MPPELDAGHVYHLFPVRTERRDALRDHLASRDIDTLVHYPTPMSAQPAFAGTSPAACPVTTTACAELVSLPLYPALDDAAVDRVITAVCEFSTP